MGLRTEEADASCEEKAAAILALLFEESPLLMGEVLPLMPLASEIAAYSGCIIYDALFVALAESEDTMAVTADEKLLRVLEGTPYAKRGVHLKDVTEDGREENRARV